MRRALILVVAACGSSSTPEPAEKEPARAVAEAPPPDWDADKPIDVGRSETFGCVVRTSGAVDCWGQPIGGPPDPSVRRIPGVVDATAISDDGACVLRKTGQVACIAPDRLEFVTHEEHAGIAAFGRGTHECFVLRSGEVACTDKWDFTKWSVLPAINDAVELAASGSFMCVRRKSGEVWCGDRISEGVPKLQPVKQLSGAVHVSVASGTAIVAAVLKDSVEFFGGDSTPKAPAVSAVTDVDADSRRNADYNLDGVYTAIVDGKLVQWVNDGEPKAFGTLANVVKVKSGCALTADGDVACWGSNDQGALGQPTSIHRSLRPPTKVVGASEVTKIVVARDDRYAVTASGEILQWGSRSQTRATPLAVPKAVGGWSELVATESGTPCVLGNDGSVWCKRKDDADLTRFVEANAISVAGEDKTILVLMKDGTAKRIRTDRESTYGNDEPTQPAPLPPGTTRVIGWSYAESCAIASDHLYCGKNWERVLGIEAATKIAPSSLYGCAIVGADLKCWQDTYNRGVIAIADAPVIAKATDVATSQEHICAVIEDGRVRCWTYHKDDDALDILRKDAVQIALAPKDKSLSGCILMKDQTVRCFGENDFGELGDGSVARSDVPVLIPGL